MSTATFLTMLPLAALLAPSSSFQTSTPHHIHSSAHHRSNVAPLNMGLIDDLQLIFSDEGKKNRAAFKERERQEQEEAQRAIMERRRNPEKMEQYMDGVQKNREELQEERSVFDFQRKVGEKGYDPLTDWKRLRAEGKLKVGSEMERDPSSSRLGSEGLVDVRTDERLPYIDQGWVDEDADNSGGWFGNLFGGAKKDEK
eukprot:CAMPEP_0185726502 /NCGR_PEP_ID=MMETSP1171-20130828/2470_1 /TAXON_ID=374046 /ORGANISM="Helicotheca tamensis, Strain CCMP826" /LENGTH=198 /DNA_ID=CAMNT_0028394871 /DNA_START=30 /DNA_END=626 /DNA_ORIENTATION=-